MYLPVECLQIQYLITQSKKLLIIILKFYKYKPESKVKTCPRVMRKNDAWHKMRGFIWKSILSHQTP